MIKQQKTDTENLILFFVQYYNIKSNTRKYYTPQVQNDYLSRNHLEINNTYRKGLLMPIIIHVVLYFPMKWLVMFIFNNTYLK